MRNVAVRAPWMSAVVVAAVLGVSLSAGSVSGRAYATPVAAAASVTGAAAPTAAGPDVAAVHRSLGGLSCIGRSFCMGVGPYSIQIVAAPTFSQVWNGQAWLAPASVPSPSGGVDLELVSVSCANDKNCIAVGGTIAQGQASGAWNGSAWRELRAPAGSSQSYLKAVACPAVDRCIAVGTAGPVPEPEAGQAARAQFWNGTSWSKLTPVTPAGSVTAVFNAISCPGPTECTVVGNYTTGSPFAPVAHALAETWNGSTWTVLPAPPSNLTDLSGVSCPKAAECVVVGKASGKLPLGSAVWSGSTWTSLTTQSPVFKPRSRSLTSVSCASSDNCIAVGTGAGPFAEQWTGGSGWKLLSMPDPTTIGFAPGGWISSGYGLSTVDCTGPASCIAVGGADDMSLSSYASFAVSWNGRTWSVLRAGQVEGLMGVSCSSVSHCLATGTWLTRTDETQILAESWNGKTMRLASTSGLYGVLSAVSCVSSSFCMAAGQGRDIGKWDGTRWTRSSTGPAPVEAFEVRLTGMSCASRNLCVALGGDLYDTPPLSQVWNGKKWQAKAFANPPGVDQVDVVRSVSCPRPGFCLAVGYWFEDFEHGKTGTLAEVWNGSRWRAVNSPSGGQDISFNAVSCITSTDCMVIGSQQRSGSAVQLIADRWNGRRWQLMQLPGTFSDQLWTGFVLGPSDISCPTANSCMAVGSHGQPGAEVDVALSWNGHVWRSVKVAGPGGLSTVSCAAASQCLAIGAPGIRTFAKAWNGRTWQVVKTINP
jgi:hypothetical protein